MREQFEKLPEIAEILHTVQFSESHNTYHAKLINSSLSVMFVQGAWYAFQEQQKRIDLIKEKINVVYNACEDNKRVSNLLDEMDELLKWKPF